MSARPADAGRAEFMADLRRRIEQEPVDLSNSTSRALQELRDAGRY